MEIVVPDAFKYLYGRPDSPIVTIPDPALRQRASEVAKIGKPIVQLCDSMVRIMSRANGVGLAAPQIAVAKRVIVVAPEGMKPVAMINPRIVKAEGEEMGLEGCLSIPGLYGEVMRAAYVEVEALDRKGRRKSIPCAAHKSSMAST